MNKNNALVIISLYVIWNESICIQIYSLNAKLIDSENPVMRKYNYATETQCTGNISRIRTQTDRTMTNIILMY